MITPFPLFRYCCNQNLEYLKRRNGQNWMSRLWEELCLKFWFDNSVDNSSELTCSLEGIVYVKREKD